MTKIMTALALKLTVKGGIDVREAFIDASFAPAFGVTLGRPGDAAGQLAVLRTAVRALEAMLTPGAIAHLPFE
jgi:hypothetical protein